MISHRVKIVHFAVTMKEEANKHRKMINANQFAL